MANICNLKTTVHCYSEQHAMEVKMGIENSFGSDNTEENDMFFRQSEPQGFWLFSADSEQDGNNVIFRSRIKWMLASLEALRLLEYVIDIAGNVPIEIEYAETFLGFTFGEYLYDGISMIDHWLPSDAFNFLPLYFQYDFGMLRKVLAAWGIKAIVFENVSQSLIEYPELLKKVQRKDSIGGVKLLFNPEEVHFPPITITNTFGEGVDCISCVSPDPENADKKCWDYIKWEKLVEEVQNFLKEQEGVDENEDTVDDDDEKEVIPF